MIGLLKNHCRFANQYERKKFKPASGTLLSPLGAQNKDLGAASQTLLNEVKLRLLIGV